jgi:hypothetical protein
MALGHSPQTVTDGLVFYYDMGNPQKSWKGAPTTNQLISPNDMSVEIWQKSGTQVTGNKLEQTASSGSHWILQNSPSIIGSYYTQSVVAKAAESKYIQIFPSSGFSTTSWTNYDLENGTLQNTGVNSATITHLGDGWFLCTHTAQATATTSGSRFAVQILTNINGARNESYTGTLGHGVYLKDHQFEQNTFATPFVNGTRSNAQAVLDLTNNNTVTATSLTYASDGTFSFNGPNYIDALISQFNLYNLNVWLYNNYIIPGNDSAIGGIVTSYQSPINFNRQTTQGVNLGGWTGSATNESVHIWSNSSTSSGFNGMTYIREQIPIGWHNFQFNWNGSTYDIWVDGIKRTTFAASFGHATLHPVNAIRIGGDVAQSYYFVGQIPSVSMFNRQLSDAEVQQNFNALRGRYGL